MRYRLRTLLITSAVAPPLLALVWFFPWLFLFAFGLAAVLAVYLIALPYCIAWLISGVAAFIGRISGQN